MSLKHVWNVRPCLYNYQHPEVYVVYLGMTMIIDHCAIFKPNMSSIELNSKMFEMVSD